MRPMRGGFFRHVLDGRARQFYHDLARAQTKPVVKMPKRAAKEPKQAASTPKRAATPKQKSAKRRTQPTRKKLPIRHELLLDILLREYPNEDLRKISTAVLEPRVAERWDEACKARGVFGHKKFGQPDYPVASTDTIDRVKKLYRGRRRR